MNDQFLKVPIEIPEGYTLILLPPLHEVKETKYSEQIIDLVNTLYEVDMRKKGKRGEVSHARACASFWLYTYFQMGYQAVANATGSTNHTSAIYAIRKWKQMLYMCDRKALLIDNEVNKFVKSLGTEL